MTGLLLSGAGFGALHAVSGPDHLLSLGPLALSSSRSTDEAGEFAGRAKPGLRRNIEFRRGAALGGLWGLGHGVGTVLLAAPVLYFAARSDALVALLRVVGDGLAGVALITLGVLALWKLRAAAAPRSSSSSSRAGPLAVGLVHGVSGAGGLLVALPWLTSGPLSSSAAFLAAFVVSSSLSMAAVAGGVARLGQRLSSAVVVRAQRVLASGSVALGAAWLVL